MKKKVKSFFVLILKLALATGLIYWLIKSDKIQLSSIKAIFQQPTLFLGLFLFTGLNLFFTSERWRSLLVSQNFRFSPLYVFKLSLIGNFFNFFIPGGVGGDVVKAFYVCQDTPGQKTKSVLTVLMDRVMGLFSLLSVAILVLIAQRVIQKEQFHLNSLLLMLSLFWLCFALFYAVAFSNRLIQKPFLKKLTHWLPQKERFILLHSAFMHYPGQKWVFLKSLLLSLLAQVFSLGFFYWVTYGLGFSEIPLWTFLFVVPVGFMVMALPISPAGVGVGQAAFHYLFVMAIGKETALGATAITAFQVFLLLYGLIGALLYVMNKPPKGEIS